MIRIPIWKKVRKFFFFVAQIFFKDFSTGPPIVGPLLGPYSPKLCINEWLIFSARINLYSYGCFNGQTNGKGHPQNGSCARESLQNGLITSGIGININVAPGGHSGIKTPLITGREKTL